MKKIIDNKNKKIIFNAPPSKSISIRAIAIAMATLKYNSNINNFEISNFSNSKDCLTALSIARQLGFDYKENKKGHIFSDYIFSNTISLMYDSSLSLKEKIVIDCEDSALCYRLFSYFIKLFANDIKILYSNNLEKRILNDKKIIVNESNYQIDCSQTSQQLTGLIHTLPFMKHNSIIEINNLISKGYIDLSVDLLKKVGINIEYSDNIININGNQKINNNFISIEGDWSAASYFFVLGAIAGDILISGLNIESKQPDAIILQLFKDINIDVSTIEKGVFSINKCNYKGFEVDITDCPDLATALVVLALNATTASKITGIHRLINKESNRRNVLLKVFSMLGGKIKIVENSFEIQPSKLTGGFADAHNDHRIAMAVAISSKLCTAPITLTGVECVDKSFPDFWKYL